MISKKTFGGGLTRILYIIVAVLFLLAFMAAFTSCMTPQKATSYLQKKDLLDDVCAEKYPVQPKPADTSVSSTNTVDPAFFQLVKRQRDSALRRLGYLEAMGKKLDSAACKKLLADYIQTVQDYEQQLEAIQGELQKAKTTVVRIKETHIDSAAISALRGQHRQLQQQYAESEKKAAAEKQQLIATHEKEKLKAAADLQRAQTDADEWEQKAVNRRNQLLKSIGLNAILILLLAWRVYRGIRRKGISLLNPIKWFT